MTALVLFSGGVDSTTAVAVAVRDGHKKVGLLHISYGSLHEEAERRTVHSLLGPLSQIWDTLLELELLQSIRIPPNIFGGGGSALMGDSPMPDAQYQDLDTEGPSPTVVPFRNANLISLATTVALVEGYDKVYAAMHATDYNRWAYPDCSPEFVGAMANAVYVGTMHQVRLVTPFIWATKARVVRLGVNLHAPLGLTWSCYRGGETHCGTCPTCIERHKAFMEGMGFDPTEYINDPYSGNEHEQR